MKKLFTICVIALCACFASKAQTLATFENDGADDILKVDGWWMPELFVIGPSIMDNTDKSGLNTSDKCVGAVNVADADWWGNFLPLKLDSPIEITEENRYLKFLAFRSLQEKEMVVYFNTKDNEIWRGKLTEANKWEGLTFDLIDYVGQELTHIEICVSANWSDPRTGWGVATYLFDNFEISNNPIPTGKTVYEPSALADFYINFEDDAQITKWFTKIDPIIEENSFEIVDNPVKSTVNPTDKVLKFDKSDLASWWQGIYIPFTGAMQISDEYKYLHVMVWLPEESLNEDRVVAELCTKDFFSKENTKSYTIWDDEVGEWKDLVLEISQIEYLDEVTVRFDIRQEENDEGDLVYINSPANTFYFDEITLNDNPMPRTRIGGSGVDKTEALPEIEVLGLDNAVKVCTSKPANVKIYSMTGVLINEASIIETSSIAASNGLYLVKIESEGKEKAVKVLVK